LLPMHAGIPPTTCSAAMLASMASSPGKIRTWSE
jgi:hypothetical protein